MAWSGDTVEALKALWAQGDLSASVIARKLGVTRNAVLGKVHRLGLSNRRSTPVPRPKAPDRPRRRLPQARPCVIKARQDRAAGGAVADPDLPGLVARLELIPAHACHWPIGDPAAPGFAFCGREAGDRIYCAPHWTLGHQPRAGA